MNKTDHLRKVEDIESHLNIFTLKFKNDDFESEWRLKEIANNKFIYLFILCNTIFSDVSYSFIFNSPPLSSTLLRAFYLILLTLSFY